jgi:hypothetical protein
MGMNFQDVLRDVHEALINSLKVTLSTAIAGEDLANNVLKIEQRFLVAPATVNGTTVIKSAPGFLHGVYIGGISNPTTIIYDNTAASGSPLMYIDPNAPIGFHQLNGTAGTGITVSTTAGVAPKMSISYR